MYISTKVPEDVTVLTVDECQGIEYDYVLLSVGRTRGLGFLVDSIDPISKETVNGRICVALTRARKGLLMFGNFDWYLKCHSPCALTQFIRWCHSKEIILDVF